jgi:hypothetical protein
MVMMITVREVVNLIDIVQKLHLVQLLWIIEIYNFNHQFSCQCSYSITNFSDFGHAHKCVFNLPSGKIIIIANMNCMAWWTLSSGQSTLLCTKVVYILPKKEDFTRITPKKFYGCSPCGGQFLYVFPYKHRILRAQFCHWVCQSYEKY